MFLPIIFIGKLRLFFSLVFMFTVNQHEVRCGKKKKKKYSGSSANQEDLRYHLMHVKILINISTQTYFSKDINKYLTELCVRELWSGVLDTGPEKLVEAAVLVGFLHGLVTFDTSAWHFFGDFSLPATLRKIVREIEGWWSTGLQTHTHTSSYLSLSLCQLSPQPFSVTLVSSCLPLSVFCSVLKKAQGRSIKVWMTWKLWSQCEHTQAWAQLRK